MLCEHRKTFIVVYLLYLQYTVQLLYGIWYSRYSTYMSSAIPTVVLYLHYIWNVVNKQRTIYIHITKKFRSDIESCFYVIIVCSNIFYA